MRLVGFSDAKRHNLKIFSCTKVVKIKDFRVQEAYSDESNLEVVIGDNTIIESSEKKFKLEPVLSEVSKHTRSTIVLLLMNSLCIRRSLLQRR